MKRLTAKELNRIKIAFNMDGEDLGAYRAKNGTTYVKNIYIENLVKEIEACWKEVGNSS